jgi:hypothetical protein
MGIKHEVSVEKHARRSGIYRCICTTRLSVVPKHGQTFHQSVDLDGSVSANVSSNICLVESHDQVRVIASSLLIRKVAERFSANDNEQPYNGTPRNETQPLKETRAPAPSILNNKKQRLDGEMPIQKEKDDTSECSNHGIDEFRNLGYTECYPNAPGNIYDSYGIVRYLPKILLEDRVRLLTTGPALLCFLRLGYKVYVRKSDGNLYPCLYEINDGETTHGLLEYGHRFPATAICADAKLLHKERVHAPIQSSDLSGNIIVLTHKYKQCPRKMDAILISLDEYNQKERYNNPAFVGSGFGEFDGKIAVMGSGGCNKVQGHFAPTSKCNKNDPLIVVGIGQNRLSRINKKLEQLAADNSVRAVFLNEKYYYANQKNKLPHEQEESNLLRFLEYYQFNEIRYVSGDSHKNVNAKFNNPSALEWGNLTFRLHRHMRLEASPFIPTMHEVHKLYLSDSMDFKTLVFNHDDHSGIPYYIRNMEDWKMVNHEITIKDVINDMINRGKINEHIHDHCCSNTNETIRTQSPPMQACMNLNGNDNWTSNSTECTMQHLGNMGG